jgi:uncharacterized protein
MEAVMKSKHESESDARSEFDNSFDLPLPPAQAWPVLMDIRRIAPCVPGAELTQVVDESTYQGRISVPLGPIALGFAGLMKFDELDAANHTARVTAQGVEAEGSGDARATAFFRLEPANGGCKVLVHMELMLSGGMAHYGSAGSIIQTTAAAMINQFAANLRAQVSGALGQSPQGFSGTGNDRSPTAPR